LSGYSSGICHGQAHAQNVTSTPVALSGDHKQIATVPITLHDILASPEFARGLNEARRAAPLNPDNGDWNYERGRCFGAIAPRNMPLRIGRALNPQALRLAEAAFLRKLPI
jgi:hypothetical protein